MMIIRAMAVTATQTYEKERIVPLQIFIETLEFVSVCVCVCVCEMMWKYNNNMSVHRADGRWIR